MFIDYKYNSIQHTVNAINVEATYYIGNYVEEMRNNEVVQVYKRTYLKSITRQFPIETTDEEIKAWFDSELLLYNGVYTPLW